MVDGCCSFHSHEDAEMNSSVGLGDREREGRRI